MLIDMNLDNEQFEDMMEEARNMIAGIYPEWTDYNYHDPGITMIEMFAWLKEIQQYYLNGISDAHLEKYLALLGINKRHMSPAKTVVKIQSEQSIFLPEGTQMRAKDIVFKTDYSKYITANDISGCFRVENNKQISWADRNLLSQGHKLKMKIFDKPFEEGNAFYIILDDKLPSGREVDLYLELFEDYPVKRNPVKQSSSASPFIPLAVISLEYFSENNRQEAEITLDETYGLIQSGFIHFTLSVPMKKHACFGHEGYMLIITLKEDNYDVYPILQSISVNGVAVSQSEDIGGTVIGTGNGLPYQEFKLHTKDILYDSFNIMIEDPEAETGFCHWEKVNDFYLSEPEDKHYILDVQNGKIIFGDCIHAQAPEGQIILRECALCRGSGGNVNKGKIRSFADSRYQAMSIINETDARGGRDEEQLKECFIRAKKELRKVKSLVTKEDYERAVKSTPGLLIENCCVITRDITSNKRDEKANNILIAVKPYSKEPYPRLNAIYIQNMRLYLEKYRLIGTEINFLSPEYIRCAIHIDILADTHYRNVKQTVKEAVKAYFAPMSAEFGNTILYNELYSVIDKLDCVLLIESLTIDVRGSRINRAPNGDVILPPNGIIMADEIEYEITANL